MNDFNWTCPHCERAVTISEGRVTIRQHSLVIKNAIGRRTLRSEFIVCPNPDCQQFTLKTELYKSAEGHYEDRLLAKVEEWRLVPNSKAKVFPTYIPQAILADYKEASLIRDLSPKASATLARRCLQGIIRDYWGVKPGRLVDEIDDIKPRVDPLTWDAIDAVRKLGNIGAHMEKDINIIIDVDPEEAELLIGLIETVLREWYVAREERRVRMGTIVAAATAKKTP
ncbi:MAG: DUF4145 domain-containing protein [Rhodoferax sp.]|jgi:hypothetical protein|nr:DUF4145 domain-containing protein [Rhodoferax sp.]